MLSTFLKALLVIWPFFKALIFKDRSAVEVLNDNRQFTGLFAVLVVVAMMFYVTLNELSETKLALQAREHELFQLQEKCRESDACDGPPPPLEKEQNGYDKSPLLDMLEL